MTGKTTQNASENDPDVIDMDAANRLPNRGEELMRVVTRFEYALKEIGYGRAAKNGEIGVKWDCFANDGLGCVFFTKIREENIAPTLLRNPPSTQVLSSDRTLDRTLDWKKGTPPQSVQELFGAVRRVRNNLVHGGKSGDKDSDRNDALVAEAIEVLKEALRWHDDLRSKFEGKW